jgi:hypothetical protein
MSSVETMKSWASLINAYEKVPLIIRDHLQMLLRSQSNFPYTILIPNQQVNKSQTASDLVCLFNEKIVVLEIRNAVEVVSTVYYFEDIDYVEIGTILLYSWIKIGGISNGVTKYSMIQYNSVNHNLFMPVVEEIRNSTIGYGEADLQTEWNKFNYIADSYGFKFLNIGRGNIQKGEKLIDIIFQPPIRIMVCDLIVKKYYKIITNGHMTILTDKEIILLKEPKNEVSNYGYILTYIACSQIAKLSTHINEDDNTMILEIHLKNGEILDSIFDPANRFRMDVFVNYFAG